MPEFTVKVGDPVTIVPGPRRSVAPRWIGKRGEVVSCVGDVYPGAFEVDVKRENKIVVFLGDELEVVHE